jgi:type IV pilus assembly protein PilC
MTAVMMVLVFKISPMFKEMFDEIAGGNAADSSERLMNTGMIAGKVCVFILLALFLLMIVIILLTKTRIGGKFIGRLTTGISPLKKISRIIQKGRLMSSLSLMLRSGTPMDEALENVEMGVSAEYAGKIKKARKFISEENANFSDALKKAEITSGMENVMLSVGEKSGTLDVVVEKIAKQYDEEISEALDGVTTRLETLLVIVLSVMVAAVLISVMLPLTSVISSIS